VNDAHERFVELYDACYRRVLGYALQHLEADAAQDVASETFLISWRRLPEVPEPPLPWLLAVARNLLRQQYGAATRRRRLEARITALTSEGDLLAWDAGEHVVERAAALEALHALPKDDIEALTLTTWHGLSPAEAATVVGCSPRAFTVRLSRARRRLADALSSAEVAQPSPRLAKRASLGCAGHAASTRHLHTPVAPHLATFPREQS
jgi:RNA polymerase sigma-70 factor (ECF subfamily)